MDDRKLAQSFLSQFEAWIDKPAAIPLKPGQDPDDEEPIWIFDWYAISQEERDDFLDAIFFDADGTLPNLYEATPTETTTGTVTRYALKDGWLPFGLAMVDLEGAKEWADEGHTDGFPDFSQLLLVNLREDRGTTVPIYCIDIDGTVVPAAEPEVYLADVSGLILCDPVGE